MARAAREPGRGERAIRLLTVHGAGRASGCRGIAARLGLAALVACAPRVAAAQDPPAAALAPSSVASSAPATEPTDWSAAGDAGGGGSTIDPFVAPIPFKNSQLGWGLMLMAGAIHRFDADTTVKPSTGAAGGFYTENHSWGLMAMEMARLQGDAWRLRGMLSHMDVRYDFYGIGQDAGEAGRTVPLEQTMDVAVGSVLRRVGPRFYAGAAVLWMRSEVELRGDPPAGLASIDADRPSTDLFAPGIQGEFDSRDDDYWPTRGSFATVKAWFYTDALGASREFQRYFGAWSWYLPLRGEAMVLATNLLTSAAEGDAPFYMLPTIGTGQYGLRGYTQGRYRDEVMTTAQAELRVHTAGRLGATAFAGFGQVAPSYGDLADASVLPAGGLGLRYQLTRQFPMHMRFDYAWGRNGNVFYFSVAEAF